MTYALGRDLGVGVGWRRELALWIQRSPQFAFVEVMAEDIAPGRELPPPIEVLRNRGTTVVPHSVSLSLAGAERPDVRRLGHLDRVARRLQAPVVSDHIAFVRSGDLDSGHLLPPARTQEALDVLVENVRFAKSRIEAPLALENIAALFEWPGAEMDEPTFISELLRRTDSLLLLDVANLYANSVNFGWSVEEYLDRIPLDRIAYVHVAGGEEVEGFYHDTHAHAVPAGPLEVLRELGTRVRLSGAILERDDRFPPPAELEFETRVIQEVAQGAAAVREG